MCLCLLLIQTLLNGSRILQHHYHTSTKHSMGVHANTEYVNSPSVSNNFSFGSVPPHPLVGYQAWPAPPCVPVYHPCGSIQQQLELLDTSMEKHGHPFLSALLLAIFTYVKDAEATLGYQMDQSLLLQMILL